MSKFLANNFKYRYSFGKITPAVDFNNLIEIQCDSYEAFLQQGVLPKERQDGQGLHGVFQSVFPIRDFSKKHCLEYESYSLGPPKYDIEECREQGVTYAAPLKVTLRFKTNVDKINTNVAIQDDVYFGDIPLMTENGTFIINGTERVVVSQLHRSPGVFFEQKQVKTGSKKMYYSARIIPSRGSWIDFEFDAKDELHVRIDRRKKLNATLLLVALGYSTDELLNYFYEVETFHFDGSSWSKSMPTSLLPIQAAPADLETAEGKLICKKGDKFIKKHLRQLRKNGFIDESNQTVSLPVADTPIQEGRDRFLAEPLVDEDGILIADTNELVSVEIIEKAIQAGITSFKFLFIDEVMVGDFFRESLTRTLEELEEQADDETTLTERAIIKIYQNLRPGENPTPNMARSHFQSLFFRKDRYDLSKVGRRKLNYKLGIDVPLTTTILTQDDLLRVVKYLVDLKNNKGRVDDIDHLGNRRVRAVGELLETQYRIGLVRMEKALKEKMSLTEVSTQKPRDFINAKPVTAAIQEFFGSSQLSQFMDQTNPLSEITHKRRLSALGPGGLTRERAGFDVRDVHPTHYGRICPIETPEGPNIGLIASLSTYARVDAFGFIETPYQVVEEGKLTSEIKYMTALEEEFSLDQSTEALDQSIGQANIKVNSKKEILDPLVPARVNGEFAFVEKERLTLMDVAPNQLVSVAASLIPFLENDDANRALMGSNMQRQAVPVIRTEAPLVGTGMERVVARDSGVTLTARRDGVVEAVDASRIVIRTPSSGEEGLGDTVDIYNLTKFMKSNQNTCINQKPVVHLGDKISKGDVIADGPATDKGELALGQNVIVAFMPWQGYNFEDSILISERLVHEDYYTTIHVEEFEVSARDTKLGKEEITRDIPNVSDEALKNIDDSGIVCIGAEVRHGDLLVGKITPKGESQLSPEEKLLRAIFGEKAGDVRDTSLRVPPGVSGTVIGVRVFTREGVSPDERALEIQEQLIERIIRDRDLRVRTVLQTAAPSFASMLLGEENVTDITDEAGDPLLSKGGVITQDLLNAMGLEQLSRLALDIEHPNYEALVQLQADLNKEVSGIHQLASEKIERHRKGAELPPGVIKMVKVYVAIKRKLSVGDKMAGRHGNKGVVSKILPLEDMPYLEDGTPVDIVLNPLGVPSRMNVGQILETHLGWAARGLGVRLGQMLDDLQEAEELRGFLSACFERSAPALLEFIHQASPEQLVLFAEKYRNGVTMSTPVFAGANEEEIKHYLRLAGVADSGQSTLFDGRSGEVFDRPVTVGIMYMLKLHHLVDDKLHARSIGPYSLVTQQPLGGKAQFGGQRLGEMEVWALEAYGAAYNLQEFLTVKSDDVTGRARMYESIVKGENTLNAGLPESFNVLVKELKALALDVELIDEKGDLIN